jgi:glycosyltransferase involved in cell wall biosynthesis
MPTVSVIVPAYNAAAYIEATVKSVQRQRFKDFELIVVDDGSKDNTADVVGACEGVTYIHKPNGGVSSARNLGVRSSSGELLAFLDADDMWHEEKLAGQVALMNRLPNCDLVRSEVTESLDELARQQVIYRDGLPPYTLCEEFAPSFQNPYFSTSAVMVRRSAFDRVNGFDETLPYAEDVDFYLKVLKDRPSVARLDFAALYKRPVPGSLGEDGVLGYEKLFAVYDNLLARHPDIQRNNATMVRRTYQHLWLRYAGNLYRKGRRAAAVRAAFRSLAYGTSLTAGRVIVAALIPGRQSTS